MPLPKPTPTESQDDFLARCIPVAYGEFPDEAQAAAVCYTQWEQGFKKVKKGKYKTQNVHPSIFGGAKEEFYSWEECISDMKAEGYSDDAAANICGAIKAGTARGGRK